MTCKNCGNELTPNAKFCESCGAKIEEIPVAEAPVEEAPAVETPVEETPVEETPAVETPVEEAPAVETPKAEPVKEAPAVEPTPEILPKKKKRKGFLVSLVAIVAVVAVVAAAFPYVKNIVAKTILPAESYYQSVEKDSIKSSIDSITEGLDAIKEATKDMDDPAAMLDSMRCDAGFSITLGEGIMSALSESAGVDLSFLNNIGMGIGYEMKDELFGLDLSLDLNNKSIIDANAVLDTDDLTAYVSVPKLTDTAMKIDIEALSGMDADEIEAAFNEGYGMTMKFYEALPDGKTLKSIVNRYLDIVLEELDDVEKEKDEISVGDVEVGCTALTVTIKEKTLENIVKAVLKEAKNDDELWNVVEDFMVAIEPSSADYVDELREMLDENYSELVSELDGSFEGFGKLDYTVYTNAKGEIVGREIEYQDYSVQLFNLASGKNRGFELNVVAEGVKYVVISAEGTVKGDTYNGEADVKVAGQSMAKIVMEDVVSTEKQFSGKITVKPSDTVAALLPSLVSQLEYAMDVDLDDIGISLDDPSIALQYNLSETTADYSLSIMNAKDVLLGVAMDCTIGEASKISVPNNTVEVSSEYDVEEWASTIDFTGLVDSLPEELAGIVYMLLMSNF